MGCKILKCIWLSLGYENLNKVFILYGLFSRFFWVFVIFDNKCLYEFIGMYIFMVGFVYMEFVVDISIWKSYLCFVI